MWSVLPYLQNCLPWMWNAFNLIIHIHLYHLPTSCWINRQQTALIVQLYWPAISKEDSVSLWKAGIKIMSAHAFLVFLGYLRFWLDTIWVARWKGLEILIPKHMWKSKNRPLEQIPAKTRYGKFFSVHPVCFSFLFGVSKHCQWQFVTGETSQAINPYHHLFSMLTSLASLTR